MRQNQTIYSKIFDVFNYIALAIIALITLIPFWHVLVGSIVPSADLVHNRFIMFPTRLDFTTYQYIFSSGKIMTALQVSIFVTVVGTLFQLFLTVLTAYPLAHKELVARKFILSAIVFTMLFGGGMVPTFFVVKSLGLLDSLASLILPSAISAFNLIVIKNFFQSIPAELEESAKLDGANHFIILFRIILPLSKPAIATFALFYAVRHWNNFFQPIMYISSTEKWPIQVILRQVVMLASGNLGELENMPEGFSVPTESVKMAVIIVAALPIMMVYPFLQKHFAKGVMLGSIKG